ncbi:hypothetical protein [Candidatus Soleaferrea massiliensis]|uniref:hypothetical protein n=1 Tax=Candidatus Soleaferrea massiliensis TaxID=1470354 RepID=UPI00058F8BE6|nr:hypothetical protein [Candidatus Soleaferrea massiliensis]
MAEEKKQTFLTYKGKPLVRKGNTIYYGYMSDPYVIMMQIISNKDDHEMNMAEKVRIQMISTDESLPLPKRIIKTSEQEGLYNAIDISSIWMDRMADEQKA